MVLTEVEPGSFAQGNRRGINGRQRLGFLGQAQQAIPGTTAGRDTPGGSTGTFGRPASSTKQY